MQWFVRHRPKGETLTAADVVTVDTATPADAIDTVRSTLPEDHVITSVSRY
ncbi:hypothetical protein [Curtobacterium sp. VKM Ac-1395]|uniref:hypothetical protein n=1 Tax=Curtobacterium sp. VKM Ac-1395 TaxID=2783815 RepID=UPI00188AFE0E|nr:hypothetical protein [Curtobacterium sp. VKM Ac-1395]MBF4592089.1 hypothetical protein [Curtobacterium sp. VKM Ac-1395]